jgi:hypothetical protein
MSLNSCQIFRDFFFFYIPVVVTSPDGEISPICSGAATWLLGLCSADIEYESVGSLRVVLGVLCRVFD